MAIFLTHGFVMLESGHFLSYPNLLGNTLLLKRTSLSVNFIDKNFRGWYSASKGERSAHSSQNLRFAKFGLLLSCEARRWIDLNPDAGPTRSPGRRRQAARAA